MNSSMQDLKGHDELWKLSLSYVAPLSLKVAILLKIPDILAQGPVGLDEILSRITKIGSKNTYGIRRSYLDRLLKLLATQQLLSHDASAEVYGLNKVSRWLVTDSPFCFAPFVLAHLDVALFRPFDHLAEMIAGDVPPGCAFESAHGGLDLWGFCKESPVWSSVFNEAMASLSKKIMTVLLNSYDGFEGLHSIVDVGGGVGECMSFVAKAYPGIRAINFDLQHVIATAPVLLGVEHIAGNMFDSIPQADAIFTRAIFHDWDDERCAKILQNCFSALPNGGKLIIVDMVLDFCGESGLIMDVLTMACNKGLERTKCQWESLLAASPFKSHRFVEMPMPWSVIEATA